jgi:hypothetical protein
MQVVGNANNNGINFRVPHRSGDVVRPARDIELAGKRFGIRFVRRADHLDLVLPAEVLQTHRVKTTDQSRPQHGDFVHSGLLQSLQQYGVWGVSPHLPSFVHFENYIVTTRQST